MMTAARLNHNVLIMLIIVINNNDDNEEKNQTTAHIYEKKEKFYSAAHKQTCKYVRTHSDVMGLPLLL